MSYRLVSNVAVVPGDPVCAPEARERVTRSFLDFCASRGWRAAFYQASAERLATYRTLELRAFKMGEEAILHPQTFTLSDSTMANVRVSAWRAERDEVAIQWYEGVPPGEVIQQLEHVSHVWLERRIGQHVLERSFSMGRLSELTATAERAESVASISPPSNGPHRATPRLVTGVATTSAGKACAFVTFAPVYGCIPTEVSAAGNPSEMQGWSLDLMRRVPDAPPGVMELLLARAIERFRAGGAQRASLGLVAMADTRHEMVPVDLSTGNRAVLWAVRLWGAAETLHTPGRLRAPFLLLNALTNYERANYERMVEQARAQLGEPAFAATWAEGRAMPPEQALAAREQPLSAHQPLSDVQTRVGTKERQRAAPSSPHGLTAREIEVLQLVAQGLSDAQVAQTLVISPRTVNAHLRSIYGKLNIASRTAATHFALEQHFV